MPRTLNRLTPIAVSRSRRKGLHADGGGLYLRVSESGTKGWIFRYGKNGKYHDLGLGPIHTISLLRARELARECRELLWAGTDPIAHRRAALAEQKASDAKVMSFKQCAEAYIAAHEAGWRNTLHRQQWQNTLAQHVYPALGEFSVASIDTAHVLKVIEPMWRTTTETASRVRGRIERVLDFAKVRGFRNGENPARWRGHLDHLLPAQRKVKRIEHHAAMPYAEMGAFMVELRKDPSPAARGLEWTILTAARTGEVLGATWGEINLGSKTWTVSAARIKAGREHRVPLSGAAMRVLGTARSPQESLFPVNPRGRHMSRLLAKLRPGLTLHGFRSSFRDWAAEQTIFPNHVVEQALAHAIPNAVEAAYRRGDLFEKRRRLMEAWAQFCEKPAPSGKVVGILPPSLSRIRSAPAPGETEERRLSRERWNDHIDRMNELEDNDADPRAFLRLIEELSPGTLTRNANEVAEAMLAEDDAAERAAAAPRRRGRPRTRQKQLRIMGTVEAYISAGLSRKEATYRAAEHWRLKQSRIDEIYRDEKLPRSVSHKIRDYCKDGGLTEAEIDEAIGQFLEAERDE